MSKRVKVSDMEVIERDLPLLVSVKPRAVPMWSDKEQKLPLLHICKRDGNIGHSRYSTSTYKVTNCNRPLDWPDVYAKGKLDLVNYRLCPRCALKDKTLEIFEATLAEYWRIRMEWTERRKAEKAQEETQHKSERLNLAERLDEFASLAIADMPRERVWNTLRFEHNGHTYEIKEIE